MSAVRAMEELKRVAVAAYFDRLGEPYELDMVMQMIAEGADGG